MARLPAGVHLRRPGYRILSALVLAVLVAGVVLLARLFGSVTPDGSTGAAPAPQPSRSVSSTEGDDSVYADTSPSADAGSSAAIGAGDAFVRAWLQPTDGRTQEQWFARLSRYALPDLAA